MGAFNFELRSGGTFAGAGGGFDLKAKLIFDASFWGFLSSEGLVGAVRLSLNSSSICKSFEGRKGLSSSAAASIESREAC